MPMQQLRPSGIITDRDIPSHEVPPEYWTDAENMAFRDVFAERINGWKPAYTTDPAIGSPLYLQNSIFRGTNYWMYGFDNGAGVTDSAGVHTDLTPAVGAPSATNSEDWTGCELNGLPVLNWGSEPHYWDRSTGSNLQPTNNWNAGETCEVIRSFKFFLMALNIGGVNDWPSVVRWSDSAAPGNIPSTWVPAPGNDAGSLSFGDTGEGITDGLSLRDQFMVYKSHSVYLMQYVGGELVFGQRQFLNTIGCLANNCATSWRGSHIVLGDGDIWLTDGNQVNSLVDKRTRRTLFANLDQEYYQRSFVAQNVNRDEVWVCYPENGNEYPNRALVIDMASGRLQEKDVINVMGTLSYRDTELSGGGSPHIAHGNVTTAAVSEAWNTQLYTWDSVDAERAWNENAVQAANDGLVGADADAGELVFMDTGDDYEEGLLSARVVRESLDFGDQTRVKLITEVWPRIVGRTGDVIKIRVGCQFEPQEQVTWEPYEDFVIGEQQKVDIFCEGRYLSFEFYSEDGRVWRITGFDVRLEPTGEY